MSKKRVFVCTYGVIALPSRMRLEASVDEVSEEQLMGLDKECVQTLHDVVKRCDSRIVFVDFSTANSRASFLKALEDLSPGVANYIKGFCPVSEHERLLDKIDRWVYANPSDEGGVIVASHQKKATCRYEQLYVSPKVGFKGCEYPLALEEILLSD